jgi:hypothetical protein
MRNGQLSEHHFKVRALIASETEAHIYMIYILGLYS